MPEKIRSESDILDPGFRAAVIKEIQGQENVRRKNEAYRRHECLKDRTDYYVLELLFRQFDSDTVHEMSYAITNISFTRKVINKLAKVYANGVKRTMKTKSDTAAIEDLSNHLDLNKKMKKSNRYLKLQKNCAIYAKPFRCGDKYDIKVMPMPPFLYDVIENPENEEEPWVYILSNFSPTAETQYALNAATANRHNPVSSSPSNILPIRGDGIDQVIADSASDKPKNRFIWWSKSFHFTTNEKGAIIEPPNQPKGAKANINPIGMLPFINMAEDQDDNFWADGGNDLADAGIKLNAMLSNMNHIAITQGYGQLFISGKNIPKSVKLGPNKAITMKQDEGEPNPVATFLTANPPLADLASVIEMYVALILSTNNLSTTGFSTDLKSGKSSMASGVAMMIDKAESIEDVEEQSLDFVKTEPKLWSIIKAWYDYYKSRKLLVDDLAAIPMPANPEKVMLKFPPPQVILSEHDKLEIIQMRMESGLNTFIEMLMRDDPSLDESAAEDKAQKILEDRMRYQEIYGLLGKQPAGQPVAAGEDPAADPGAMDPNMMDPAMAAGKKAITPGKKKAAPGKMPMTE